MSESVRLDSLDRLRDFRAKFAEFAQLLQAAAYESQGDLARTMDWLAHGQTLHWKNELRVRNENLLRAKSALKRKQLEKSPTGGRQSTVEEEQAFAKAQRRFAEAEEKVAAVKRGIRKLEQAGQDYRPAAQALLTAVEVDVARGLARLDRMVVALEAYFAGGPAPAWVVSEVASGEMRRAPTENPIDGQMGAAGDAGASAPEHSIEDGHGNGAAERDV